MIKCKRCDKVDESDSYIIGTCIVLKEVAGDDSREVRDMFDGVMCDDCIEDIQHCINNGIV